MTRLVPQTTVNTPSSHGIPQNNAAAVAILALSVFLCSACSKSAEHYLRKGNELEAAGKHSEASLNYRRAIQENPKMGEAYYKLGVAELKLQNGRGAFEALNRAVRLSPGRTDFKVALGDLCLAGYIADPSRPQNLYQSVGKISDELLSKDANSFAGLRMKGYLALLDSRPAEAAEYFQRASQQRPDEADVVIGLINSLFVDRREPAAEQVARQYIQGHKTYGPVYDVLYAHYVDQKRLTGAEDILKLKVANNPVEPAYVCQLAQFYWRAGKQAQSLDLVARMLEKPKRPSQAHSAAGDFYGSIAHWDQARQQFELGLAAAPAQKVFFQKRIVNLLLAQGNRDQAAPLVDQILKAAPQDEEAISVRANLRLQSGQTEAVRAAAEDYKSLLQRHSSDPKLHFDLGQARERLGEFAVAKVEFREAIRLQNSYLAPRLGLIELAFAERKLDEAVRAADELLSVQPLNTQVNTQARLLKVVALREMHKYGDARSELRHVLQAAPKDGRAYLQLGLLEIEQKNYPAAEAAFKKLQDSGNDAGATYGLAIMYSVRGQMDKASAVLKKELEKYPRHPLLHELVAAIAIQAQDFDRAIGEYRILLTMAPSNKTFYFQLAEALHRKGDMKGYVSTLEQAQKIFPRDLTATLALATALERSDRRDAAIQQYRRAMELKPDDPRVLNNLAFAMVETNGNLDEALRLAERAVQRVPDQPVFVDTLGWIYVKKKMTASAVQVLNGVVKKQPDNPVFCYHYGVALIQKGDLQRAKATLQDALTKKPSPDYAEKIRQTLAPLG